MALVKLFLLCLVAAINLQEIYGHGRMWDPINRSSAWRKGFKVPPNFTDNEHFCGGIGIHYGHNKGKCGECGDNYAFKRPRPNENGGKYGTGLIVKEYLEGETINVTVHLTANHLGHFEFFLCPLSEPTALETEECFQKFPLAQPNGDLKYRVYGGIREFKIPLVLPKGVNCPQCVLRWHYRTANSWGNCPDGSHRRGCGNQEVYRNCADVRIRPLNTTA